MFAHLKTSWLAP